MKVSDERPNRQLERLTFWISDAQFRGKRMICSMNNEQFWGWQAGVRTPHAILGRISELARTLFLMTRDSPVKELPCGKFCIASAEERIRAKSRRVLLH
jgi:hypothetical protein